jgi:hypothetical protein
VAPSEFGLTDVFEGASRRGHGDGRRFKQHQFLAKIVEA